MSPIVDKNGNIALFGRFSWGNFVDWLVTLVMGQILVRLTLELGGVSPETHIALLPLFGLLLVLHGIWLAVDDMAPRRISQIPMLFLPLMGWGVLSVFWLSPAPWLGQVELVYALEAFIFFWVASNNVRTRNHILVVLLLALVPLVVAIANAIFQFIQDPSFVPKSALSLSPDFFGQSTGVFTDPASFSILLLLLYPGLLIVGMIKRYSVIQRILFYYLAAMVLVGLLLAQVGWAMLLFVPMTLWLVWQYGGCSRKRFIQLSALGALGMLLIVWFFLIRPELSSEEGLANVRPELWLESLRMFLYNPISGVGAGAFSQAFEQSAAVALPAKVDSPQNDFLLLLSQFGLVGTLFCLVPVGYTLYHGVKRWQVFPVIMDLGRGRRPKVQFERFILSVSLAGCVSFLIGAFCSFTFYVPALLLYGLLFLSVLVKYGFLRRCHISDHLIARWSYFVLTVVLAGLLLKLAPAPLRALALEQEGRATLNQVVSQRLHMSSDETQMDRVLRKYKAAVAWNASNADAWIGLSAATCQLYYRDTAQAEALGAEAAEYAQRAIDISPEYAAAWGQLGVARLLSGAFEAGEAALDRALELAPNKSQMHYLKAAYLSHFPERQDEAREALERLLELTPDDLAARRLSQRLLVL